MKIEKLNENKIRILMKNEDFKDKDVNIHTIMTSAIESQSFFLELLAEADRKFGFNTDGCKLLIEAYSSPDNDFVFTVTKYLDKSKVSDSPPTAKLSATPKLRISPRRKNAGSTRGGELFVPSKAYLCAFDCFEYFCELCSFLAHSDISVRRLARSISLHKFNDVYILILFDFVSKDVEYKHLFSIFSEFGSFRSCSPNFRTKVFEHGECVLPHNALNRGIKYFVHD